MQSSHNGSVLGGILLIAGSSIGAGMLGLPVVTGLLGFYPAIVVFLFCWLFMSITGLLLLEVNLWLGEHVNIVSLSEKTLGKTGKWVSFYVYIFLFYSLLIAYMDASGSLSASFIDAIFGVHVPNWIGSLFFMLLFGVFVYLGTKPVDGLNRLLMVGLILSYILLIGIGASDVKAELLESKRWGYSLVAIPVIIISFGFHNMIPSITDYLRGNRKKMIIAIIMGAGLPLIVYVLWEWLVLGILPFGEHNELLTSQGKGEYISQAIKLVTGNSWVSVLTQYFAFFAITTSFLAQALGLVDFLEDACHFKATHFKRFILCCLVLVPPFVFVITYPGLFILALGYAGGFGAILLFGILPALMVWELRYKRKVTGYGIVRGGRFLLSLVILIGVCVMALELVHEIWGSEIIIDLFKGRHIQS